MSECENCRYALWDYETDDSLFDNPKAYEWYVSGCMKGIELKEDCEYFTEKSKRNGK